MWVFLNSCLTHVLTLIYYDYFYIELYAILCILSLSYPLMNFLKWNEQLLFCLKFQWLTPISYLICLFSLMSWYSYIIVPWPYGNSWPSFPVSLFCALHMVVFFFSIFHLTSGRLFALPSGITDISLLLTLCQSCNPRLGLVFDFWSL